MHRRLFFFSVALLLLVAGCGTPKVTLFPDATEPLQEQWIEGKGRGKVLVVSISDIISDIPEEGFFFEKPSLVQEVVSQLKLAEQDPEIKAVLLKIDSPGGSVTASDVLYHEIATFKERTGVKVIASTMDLATSGAYYIALPADRIIAHPTTVTGSVGVIFMGPKLTGLMEKIGVEVEVSKSGVNKDMGSPFRASTKEEKRMMENLIQQLAERFFELVAKHRHPTPEAMADVRTARVYLAREALELGLVDSIGYLTDALSDAKTLAGLPEDAQVVVYRRNEYPDDNLYNPVTTQSLKPSTLGRVWPLSAMGSLSTGFYYLWGPAAGLP